MADRMGKVTDEIPAPAEDRARVVDRDDLPPDGSGDDVVTGGMAMANHALVVRLKARRESMGLTIEDVARRSRLSIVTVGKLESHRIINPTLDTLFRHAMALDALVTLDIEPIEPDEDAP